MYAIRSYYAQIPNKMAGNHRRSNHAPTNEELNIFSPWDLVVGMVKRRVKVRRIPKTAAPTSAFQIRNTQPGGLTLNQPKTAIMEFHKPLDSART